MRQMGARKSRSPGWSLRKATAMTPCTVLPLAHGQPGLRHFGKPSLVSLLCARLGRPAVRFLRPNSQAQPIPVRPRIYPAASAAVKRFFPPDKSPRRLPVRAGVSALPTRRRGRSAAVPLCRQGHGQRAPAAGAIYSKEPSQPKQHISCTSTSRSSSTDLAPASPLARSSLSSLSWASVSAINF